MKPYSYQRGGILHCDKLSLEKLASKFGTPFYVYSANEIRQRYRRIAKAFAAVKPLVCYSVKANGNLSILRLLAEEGCGFDIVSQGELFRVLKAGGKGNQIVFAGVGKTEEEIANALKAKVHSFNAESEQELEAIDRVARRMKVRARVALRVNPDVDPKTHVYITTGKRENKFGVDFLQAKQILRKARKLKNVDLQGLHVHLGSQIQDPKPYVKALKKFESLFAEFPNGRPEIIDLGGGFGISYQGEEGMNVEALAKAIVPVIQKIGCRLHLEPGRFLVASSGALVTRVVYTKQSGKRSFLITDAGMNDLIRPSLYEAYHRIWPVKSRGGSVLSDVVGPICESGDFFAKDRKLPKVQSGDLVAILDAGAYGFTMASHYNSRPNPPEILVSGNQSKLVRKRESLQDLIRGE